MTLVVVCDPELIKRVLRHDRIFDKGGPIFDRGREVGGNGLVTCPYSAHRRQRRLLQPAFNRDRLPGYADMMTEQITTVVNSWSDGQVFDVVREMHKLSSAILAETLFSSRTSNLPLHQIVDDLDTIFSNIFWRTVMPNPIRRLGNRSFRRAKIRLRGNLGTVIAERRSQASDREDLLTSMLTVGDSESDDQGLTDSEIYDQVATFYIAGTETSANALTWALYMLDRNPDVARQLHTEIDTVLAGRPARYTDLPQLKYARQIITETLRIRPPVWLFTRTVTEDTELGGYQLPAGTAVIYSPYLLHHRPDVHPAPESFDPSRWEEKTQYGASQPRTMIPFGEGAGKCIGDNFAIIEVTLALATIAGRWDLSTLPRQDPRPARSFPVLHPRKLHMRVSSRSDLQGNR